MNELTLSVTQLNNYIKNIFDAEEMLFGVNVFGEITNLKYSGRAVYFDIKDEDASLPCIVFDAKILKDVTTGDKVTIKGQLNFYVKFGRLSLIASKITKFGVGELYQKFIELKARLEKEGVFDERFKKQIPEVSKRIGVVTSETGAVIHDIINVTRRKNKNIDIILYPVKVQGVGAVEEIIKGVEFFDNYDVDCIIVARGGGSFEDYAPFNSEEIVRCIFKTKKPLISAIGHETDWSLIDFVADLRAATPSIAAEIAVFDMEGYKSMLSKLSTKLPTILFKTLNNNKKSIANLSSQLMSSAKIVLQKSTFNLKTDINKANTNFSKIYENKQKILELLTREIELNNPLSILKRGYARVELNNKPINSVAQTIKGDIIDIKLLDGDITAEILEIKERKNEI